MTDKKSILKSASIISLVTIVSRILGYVREQRIALLLGLPTLTDNALWRTARRLNAPSLISANALSRWTQRSFLRFDHLRMSHCYSAPKWASWSMNSSACCSTR